MFQKYRFVICIGILLFMLPFFWLSQGQMDLGGDESRIFFYDPIHFLQSLGITGLPEAATMGRGTILVGYYNIPYVALIAVLKFILVSPTYAIATINGIKLSGAFIAMFFLVFSFLEESYKKWKRQIAYTAGILAGIFYVSSLGSYNLVFDWTTSMNAHNQVFIYPLVAFLLFRFLTRRTYIYLWIILFLTFIFAPNFSWLTAPQLFAFYPFVLLFLITYVGFFLKKPIYWKSICIGAVLFLSTQAFQLVGQAYTLFSSGNYLHERVANKALSYEQGIGYFISVAPHGKALLNLFLPSNNYFLGILSVITPLVLLLGFAINKKREFLFIAIFFVITFFFVTANITHSGFLLYKSFFTVPAFSIFRVFYIKWLIVFLFFYSLLFGFSIHSIIQVLKPQYAKWFCIIVFCIYTLIGMPLFLGLPIKNNTIPGSNRIKTDFIMDPTYEKTLQFFRNLPNDGKVLVLPLTDFYNQVILGTNNGAYVGPSTISLLTQKYSFVGDQDFGYTIYDPAPYSEKMKKFATEKNYEGLLSIFATLNIRYILLNTNPKAYENGFPQGGPFQYIRESLPKTAQGYSDFIHQFPVSEIYKTGFYAIYKFDDSVYNPTIFIPKGIYQSNNLSMDKSLLHFAFLSNQECKQEILKIICSDTNESGIEVRFTMVNPLTYTVTLSRYDPSSEILLVMQHMYDSGWKLKIDGKEIKGRHVRVNGYANGWVILGKDFPKTHTYSFVIQHDEQRYFWYGTIITVTTLVIIFGLLIKFLVC